MATDLEFAAFSYGSYNPSDLNEIVMAGWNVVTTSNPISGFAASVYKNGNEIVIAFRGTDTPVMQDFRWANVPAAAGIYTPTVMEAIKLVADVMHANPGAAISFTGHSLGGGFAELMALFFNLPAVVFATAPFANTARNIAVLPEELLQVSLPKQYFNEYEAYELSQGRGLLSVNQQFRDYASAFASSEASGEAMYQQRRMNSSEYHIVNEVNSVVTPESLFISVNRQVLSIGETTLDDAMLPSPEAWSDATQLHSMALHIAVLASSAFREASAQLPTLIELIRSESVLPATG